MPVVLGAWPVALLTDNLLLTLQEAGSAAAQSGKLLSGAVIATLVLTVLECAQITC